MKYSGPIFSSFCSVFLNLCNYSDQKWYCYSLTFARSLGELNTLGFALGFLNFPRDLANVNEWKIMFDPLIVLCKSHYIIVPRDSSTIQWNIRECFENWTLSIVVYRYTFTFMMFFYHWAMSHPGNGHFVHRRGCPAINRIDRFRCSIWRE